MNLDDAASRGGGEIPVAPNFPQHDEAGESASVRNDEATGCIKSSTDSKKDAFEPYSSPTVILLVGMAGSGKTTLTTGLYNYLTVQQKKSVYTINLDPAVLNVSFPINIDIRSTVNYKEVMKQYKLGPNGAIMTCLNLFATRFEQVLGYLDKRRDQVDYVLIDTPGQIEVFNWSASGTIIIDSLACTYPCLMCFVVDTVRCDSSPITMMSNMLYACSVLYKSKLPFVTVFNKIDVVSHSRCLTWMRDYEAFQEAVMQDESFMASLTRSCALTLMEFYEALSAVGVSAATGVGMTQFDQGIQKAVADYHEHYVPWLRGQRERMKEAALEKVKRSAARLKRDLKEGGKASRGGGEMGDGASSVTDTSGVYGRGTLMKDPDEDEEDENDDDSE